MRRRLPRHAVRRVPPRPGQAHATALGLNSGEPLLSIERVSFTYGDKPMEWRLGICVTDNHHYMNELE